MSFAISNKNGDHLGFILLSGGPDTGDCLVRSMAVNAKAAESSEASYLDTLQLQGELRWERVKDEFHIYDPEGGLALTEKGGLMSGSGCVYTLIDIS